MRALPRPPRRPARRSVESDMAAGTVGLSRSHFERGPADQFGRGRSASLSQLNSVSDVPLRGTAARRHPATRVAYEYSVVVGLDLPSAVTEWLPVQSNELQE